MLIQEHILHPGDVVFQQSPGRIKTVLGSCVAVTFWVAETRSGGMCHFLLDQPNREENPTESNRYGCFALNNLLETLEPLPPDSKFDIGLFGGGNLFPASKQPTIGERNVRYAKEWLVDQGFHIKNEDVLGNICRTLILDLETGSIYLKRYSPDFEGSE